MKAMVLRVFGEFELLQVLRGGGGGMLRNAGLKGGAGWRESGCRPITGKAVFSKWFCRNF